MTWNTPRHDVAGSDTRGIAELLVPAGRIQLVVWKDQAEARISLDVADGGSASAEVTLAPAPPQRP